MCWKRPSLNPQTEWGGYSSAALFCPQKAPGVSACGLGVRTASQPRQSFAGPGGQTLPAVLLPLRVRGDFAWAHIQGLWIIQAASSDRRKPDEIEGVRAIAGSRTANPIIVACLSLSSCEVRIGVSALGSLPR